jgi:methylaspartate mutase epsilon subunit
MHAERGLVVQPRMGFANPRLMRAGLQATRRAATNTVGTITLDSYTRLGDLKNARSAIAEGRQLNGYPLVALPAHTTVAMVAGLLGPQFPIQVRHGSAQPQDIILALARAGLWATEGGPVSYCLPYGRVPLRSAIESWQRSCDLLVEACGDRAEPHLETFGGCLLGQLCPPSLLIALSVLEAMFFCQRGLRSVSLSYAQQTHPDQDAEAIAALRLLAGRFVPAPDCHLVLYTYMGVYPRTGAGARALLAEAARLAVRIGVERLIVKTVAEAHRIPTIPENVQALQLAGETAAASSPGGPPPDDTGIYAEARGLIERVLDLSSDLGTGLLRAFQRGYLDVPYCLHPDNVGAASSYLESGGRLRWANVGHMPIRAGRGGTAGRITSGGLLSALNYIANKFDTPLTGASLRSATHSVPAGLAAIGAKQ